MTILTRNTALVRTVQGNQSDLTTVVMGETGAAGQPYRIDGSDNLAYLSDAAAGDSESAKFHGYLLGNATINQKVQAQIGGRIFLGEAAIEGTFYFVSGTAGETEDCSAQVAGNAGQLIGHGMADGSLNLTPLSSGGVIPT